MRACIIGIMNLKHMTLMSLYTSFFERNGISYDVIYVDEYGIEEKCTANKVYKFTAINSRTNFFAKRLQARIYTLGFKWYCEKILKKQKYDFIVVWREETAILLNRCLERYFNGKYCVNIRDIEICEGRKKIENLNKLKVAVKNSAFNTVSSDGFLQYLPVADYLFVHSANKSLIDNYQSKRRVNQRHEGPIIISNVGTFRNEDYCFRLADYFGNDIRFELRFIGQGSERMQQYAKRKKYINIKCSGSFQPNETLDLLNDADIINCAYGNDNLAEKTKLPIRFYYAVYMGIPVLATDGTWISKTAKSLGFGIEVPEDNKNVINVADSVYTQFLELDRDLYNKKLQEYIDEIRRSHQVLENKLVAINKSFS